MKLYTYPGNTRALQTLIAARYNGIEIEVPAFEMGVDNKTPEFLEKSPMGKVPVLETEDGCLSEATSIASYVARMRNDVGLFGTTFFESGEVEMWCEFAKNEIDLAVGTWIYPILGFTNYNKGNTDKAKIDLSKALSVLQNHLAAKYDAQPYLVGQQVTLADIVVVCSLLNAYKLVLDPSFVGPFGAVTKWFEHCTSLPEFTAILGETVCCTKAPEEPGNKGGGEKGEGKKGKDKKEKKEEKKEAPKDKAAEAREKQIKKAIKEGGKKAQDIAGAADLMLGLEFYCTTMDESQGDLELLAMAMDAANAEVDPSGEERKGGSGHIGKMLFSAGVEKLVFQAYVPAELKAKIDAKVWITEVAKSVGGKVLGGDGLGATAESLKDEDKGKFPLKDKDTAIAAAIAYLKSKGCFPETNDDDDDDEICFGDDAFDEINAEYGY